VHDDGDETGMTGTRGLNKRFVTAVTAALLTGAFALIPTVAADATVAAPPDATPQIGGSPTSGTDGTIEVTQQLTQCGTTMYAVGTFKQVRNPGSSAAMTRNNAFAFNAGTPHTITGFNPNLNGPVNTAACAPDGNIFLGGSFTTAGGVATKNFVKVNAATGARMAFTGFANPAGLINHMEVVTDAAGVQHLLVGGNAAPYLRSLNPTTGVNDHYVDTVSIAGTYVYPNVATNTTKIYNMNPFPAPYDPARGAPATQIQPAVLMTGVFTSVGGQHHEQIVRINLTASRATVSPWSPVDLYTHCFPRQPFYAQDAAFSPDMSQIFTATTGQRTAAEYALPPASRPQVRSGPCDATIAYQATNQAEFTGRNWINYTGCDSLFSVAVDANTVYAGGHQRWQNDWDQCTSLTTTTGGKDSVAQMGLSTINPLNGLPTPGPERGGRGLGVPDLLKTPAGLWIASDNQANTNKCAGQSGHMGICFLPG
jgi:hypothetical protein